MFTSSENFEIDSMCDELLKREIAYQEIHGNKTLFMRDLRNLGRNIPNCAVRETYERLMQLMDKTYLGTEVAASFYNRIERAFEVYYSFKDSNNAEYFYLENIHREIYSYYLERLSD